MNCLTCYLQAIYLPCKICRRRKVNKHKDLTNKSAKSMPPEPEYQDLEDLWHLEILMRPG